MRLALIPIFFAITACGSPASDMAASSVKVEKPAVSGPTVGELQKRGMAVVDEESAGGSCGSNCVVDGFSAIYMGFDAKAGGDPAREFNGPAREFRCPVESGEMETWKCQALKVSNG